MQKNIIRTRIIKAFMKDCPTVSTQGDSKNHKNVGVNSVLNETEYQIKIISNQKLSLVKLPYLKLTNQDQREASVFIDLNNIQDVHIYIYIHVYIILSVLIVSYAEDRLA